MLISMPHGRSDAAGSRPDNSLPRLLSHVWGAERGYARNLTKRSPGSLRSTRGWVRFEPTRRYDVLKKTSLQLPGSLLKSRIPHCLRNDPVILTGKRITRPNQIRCFDVVKLDIPGRPR
jgi:hypothetical protein